jgi:asparagine synthase (glutamine-hydrolysing)
VSGIVGILHLDGAPVDVQLLRRMTDALAFRGPDAQEIWVSGPVGFGHTLLRTTDESARERQPLSLDAQVWITADARVDARTDLVRKLRERGRNVDESAPDVELILHAYHVWGEDCLHHLLGDFVFAIWDATQRKLFCARDPFGVKPFFYACVGNCLIFSNTLDCIRLHPAVSDRLNELAIADFLLFVENQDPATTVFADIQRLPAAHALVCVASNTPVSRRYWTLPTDGRIRYKKDRDYVEHYWSLFQQAVRDRLRTDRFVVSMSGGLDSPAVAAVAKRFLVERSRSFQLRAFTYVHERLIPDQEGHYAGLVAEHLGIPIQFIRVEEHEPFEGWATAECHSPEPQLEPYDLWTPIAYRQIASSARVLLTGYGGDPMMFPSTSYLLRLLRQLRIWPLARGFARYWWSYRRFPPLGGMRQRIRTWFGVPPQPTEYPDWLNPSFTARLNLRNRWEEGNREPAPLHPNCPEAYQKLVANYWPDTFEAMNTPAASMPVEARHPFFDLRLIRFVLSIPPIPWYWDKALFREALRGVLPEEIRRRPKAPLAGDPIASYFRMQATHWVDQFVPVPELSEYVVRERIPRIAGSERPSDCWLHLRPLALNLWLQGRRASSHRNRRGSGHETAS